MSKTIVKLAYKQIMDATSTGNFEKNVLYASYQEFLLKSQAYNPEGKFKTFEALKASDGRANSLHYKLSFAVGHFIETLKNKIPVLTDNLGGSIGFEVPKFELIASDITTMEAHKVAIIYTTGDFILKNTLGEYIVLSLPDSEDTFTVKIQDNLSVVSYKEVSRQTALNGHTVLAN